jgi:hypothetical protein
MTKMIKFVCDNGDRNSTRNVEILFRIDASHFIVFNRLENFGFCMI